MTAAVAQDQLRAFVERIERLEEEKQAIADDIKEVYAEAKGNGFDTKVLRQVIRLRKMDRAERLEQEAILELYLAALGMAEAPAEGDRSAGAVVDAVEEFRRSVDRSGHTVTLEVPGHEPVVIEPRNREPGGVSPAQRELARHALGLPNDRRLSYRNRFVAVPGTPAHADWLKMTAAGWAREVATAPPSGQSALGSGPGQPLTQTVGGPAPPAGDAFCLTLEGAGLAIAPGERLDPEDFASVDGRAAGSPERLDAGAEGAGGQSAGHA